MFRLEQNISSLKEVHKRFDNQLTLNKVISEYNPHVCLLDHRYKLLEYKEYKGVLLNLSCKNHAKGTNSYSLFDKVQPTTQVNTISEDEFIIKQVRERRVSRFRDHHFALTTCTVSL